jgi:hypothetical protein
MAVHASDQTTDSELAELELAIQVDLVPAEPLYLLGVKCLSKGLVANRWTAGEPKSLAPVPVGDLRLQEVAQRTKGQGWRGSSSSLTSRASSACHRPGCPRAGW